MHELPDYVRSVDSSLKCQTVHFGLLRFFEIRASNGSRAKLIHQNELFQFGTSSKDHFHQTHCNNLANLSI